MSPISVAIVGCGVWAEMITESVYSRLGSLGRLVATVDFQMERAEQLAARLGARAYRSLDDAFQHESIDAVDVRVPHAAHAVVALAAIAQGKHVLVEKPIATTLNDAERIVAAAENAGVTLSVGENYTFLKPVLVARKLLDEGAIGRLLTVRTTRAYRIGTDEGWLRDGWRESASQAGGVLMDQGPHQVNMLHRLAGNITHVHAYGDLRPGEHAEDVVVVNCRFASGLIGQQLYCWNTDTPAPGPELVLYGERGSIEMHLTYHQPGGGTLLLRPDLPEGRSWATREGDYYDSALPVVEDWLHACRGEKPPAMPGKDGLRDLRVVLAAYRSLETGQEIAIDE